MRSFNYSYLFLILLSEGHECLVLEGAQTLFKRYNVKYILTEWSKMMFQRHKYGVACPSSKVLETAKRLVDLSYVPFDVYNSDPLDFRDSDTWKYGDIVWKKRGELFITIH